jgi:hypothetical protein
LHKDGIGSSRILFSEELKQLFPNGYRIAFPDRSCGLAINADLSPKEAEEIRDLVEGIHNNATTPMSSKLYNPDDLNIKQEWILPIDAAFSQQLIE